MESNYCLIQITDDYKINCLLIKKNMSIYQYPICFTGYNYDLINQLIKQHDCGNSLSISHIKYIFKEVYKANLCLLLNQIYIQS
uniref:Orf83 n=1 Tax=Gracilaria firma TaxID=2510791 RepID=A0A2Z2JLN5_9FLOR|nr:orf83 [Gracilaria changii]ART65192.1 orf83 [Gracilaria changii]